MKGQTFIEPVGAEPAAGSVASGHRPWISPSVLRAGGFGLLCLAVLFAAGFASFANHVSKLETPGNLPAADAIIVLTGGHSRLGAAIDLLKSGKGQRLLISGVHPMAKKDDLRAATGGDRKLFSCCVDVDYDALDTIGNAEESAKWVRNHDYDSVILVTNNYHMPRTLLEMGRLLGNAELEPYPVVNTRLDDGGWLVKPEALRVLFTEYNKYLLALVRVAVQPRPVTDGFVTAATAAGDH